VSNHNFFAHGSKWLRADFHLHTKHDKEFKFTGTDKEFILNYIEKLKATNISIGVIANHNKFDRDEFKELQKAAAKENIYLMAGVELSVKDGSNGIHTLIVFHEDWFVNETNEDYINNFLKVTFAGQTCYDSKNARSNHDLNETLSILDGFSKDYFIVFAHVEEETGLWGALKGGRIQELGKSEKFCARTAAFQKVRSRDKRKNVKNRLGDSYPAEVEGSDPKSIEEIGKGESTFIKIGAFTYEAVRFALKPGTERLSTEPPTPQKHSSLRSISFEGGMFDGQIINLSADLNCFIGIRGSGKSAVLECVRYALELGFPDDEEGVDRKYKEDLVRYALGSGGKIVLTVQDAQGKSYEVHRILNEQVDLYYEAELQSDIKPKALFNAPLYFGQKELVKRGEGSERELIERLLGSKLETIRHDIKQQRQRVLDLILTLDKLKDLDALEQEYISGMNAAKLKLDHYKKHDIEKKLQRQVEFDADVTGVQKIVNTINEYVLTLESFISEQQAELFSLATLKSNENSDLITEVNNIITEIQKTPESLSLILGKAKCNLQDLRDKYKELVQRREALKGEFASIERKLSEQLQQKDGVIVRLDDFVKLNNELRNAKLALDEIAKSRTKKDSLHDSLIKELKKLSDLWHREFKLITSEVDKLNSRQIALRINPHYKGDKEAFLKEIQTHMRGSKIREATLKSIVDDHADFISVYKSLNEVCGKLGDTGAVFRKYFNEAKATLLTWQVPNSFKIEFHGKELSEHSLGQRASALILFILNQSENDVIIIDQPEDDLDNQTIFEDVVKLVRELKPNMQFLFATHNANFPVLGDAEQVVVCKYTNGNTDLRIGSIDQPVIQEAIVSIMEGGKDAFARRKEIYKLWKQ